MDYAVTVKKVRKPISIAHYTDYLSWLSQFGEIGNVNFETTRGLHVHFEFMAKKIFQRRDWYEYEKHGWNVRAVPVYFRHGWTKYSEKDSHLSDSKENKKEYERKFLNDDEPSEDETGETDDVLPTKKLF